MSHTDELFDYLKKTELYKFAKEDLDALNRYLSVDVQVGSLAYLCGMKQIQAEIEDELPWLAGYPSMFKNPTIEEAVYEVKILRARYEKALIFLVNLVDYGVEKFIQENLDMEDEYYVQLDTRDKIVDRYIEKKPETFEELDELAYSDTGYRLIQSGWHEAYGDQFGLYYLREKVGFDRAQYNVEVESIDIDRFMRAKQDLQGNNYSELPRIIVEYVDPDNEKDLPVVLPLQDNHFRKIEITLSHHVQFVFQRNNSLLEDDGRRKKDIYLLKTTVEPAPGYEYLGNIGNYSYDEMSLVVQNAVMDLYNLTGIKLSHDKIRLNDVELNLTFRQNCDFNELMRSVSYYQNYTRKGYVTKEFKTADEGIVHFCFDMSGCTTEDQYTNKKRRIVHKYSKMRTTGFTTSTRSVSVKLYDKKEETIAYAESQGYDLKIEGPEALIRLEFRIRNRDQLKRYFATGSEDVYLWDLSQEKIEKTYTSLVEIFFKKTYEEGYVPDSINALIGIVSSLDTSKKGGKWKQDLIKAILSQEIWQKSTPALLTEKDFASVIQYNHTFARHPEEYKRILWNLFKESEIYPKGQNNAYDMLYNFLNKTYSLKSLAEKRRVGYAVSAQGEKLPDMDKKVEEIVYMRNQWVEIKNTRSGGIGENARTNNDEI